MTPLFSLQDNQKPFPMNFQIGRASIDLPLDGPGKHLLSTRKCRNVSGVRIINAAN